MTGKNTLWRSRQRLEGCSHQSRSAKGCQPQHRWERHGTWPSESPGSPPCWHFGFIYVCVCVYIYIYIFFFKINLFIFDWAGSSLLPGLFSGCRKQVLVCSCGVWASYGSGLSCCERGLQGTCISGIALSGLISCGSQALEPRLNSCGPWVQWLRVWNLGSSQTRDWTCVSCNGRWTVYYWATREVLNMFIYLFGCTRS